LALKALEIRSLRPLSKKDLKKIYLSLLEMFGTTLKKHVKLIGSESMFNETRITIARGEEVFDE
jgi:hypothetical protein